MRVIGTAGHIDHGKSSLVRALTGIDPDRLPEEKARGMTIELGFAWLDLGFRTAGGEPDPVGVVDVPGHERFVRHMLAGVGGIDLALLVIAADEAVMPQTREHLAILDLLDVRHGVVALTKCDLVDAEWLELVSAEVREVLSPTSLAASPIVPCSSVNGEGLEALRAALATALRTLPEREDRERPHLPIDRVFSRSGYGTIVTGTLLDGTLSVGQEVELAPSGRKARVRGLQSHHRQCETVGPGRRVAVNLGGVAVEELARGMVVCRPGSIAAAHFLDLRLRAVRAGLATAATPNSGKALTHGMAVTVHSGAAEAAGRLRLLDAEALEPGQEGWAQVRLESPIAVQRGDRCVLRIPSPAATVAGGTVVVVNPPRRRRFDRQTISQLDHLLDATPEELLLDALRREPATAAALAAQSELPIERTLVNLAAFAAAGTALCLEEGTTRPGEYWATPDWLAQATRRLQATLTDFHQRQPLRRGMAGETLREEWGVSRKLWQVLVERWQREGLVAGDGDLLRIPHHVVRFTPEQQGRIDGALAVLRRQPFNPPGAAELALQPDLLAAAREQGLLEQLAEGIVIAPEAYQRMRDWALAAIDREGQLTVAALRDHFETSRKLALALLEHLDDLRLTRRLGEGRVRGSARLADGV